jgi:hypothetical protein
MDIRMAFLRPVYDFFTDCYHKRPLLSAILRYPSNGWRYSESLRKTFS